MLKTAARSAAHATLTIVLTLGALAILASLWHHAGGPTL